MSILDDTTLTTEKDDVDGERYKKNMKVIECRRAKQKHIRLVFIFKNSHSSNRKIALNINTKVVYMPSILAMDWQVARQLENQSPGCRHAGWFHREQICQGCS